jgi:hypothetical protein
MVEKEFLTKEACEAILKDWKNHRNNPDAVFFSPLAIDVAGKKE